jgi:hypothetical protein
MRRQWGRRSGADHLSVALEEGRNQLTFRVADDKSTAKSIVVYLSSVSEPQPPDTSQRPSTTLRPGGVPIVFLITSPQNGDLVTSQTITVRGLAPPGARVVRDISLALDDETVARSDGTWSMSVELDVGVNTLVFRLGDDRSTEQVIRVLR